MAWPISQYSPCRMWGSLGCLWLIGCDPWRPQSVQSPFSLGWWEFERSCCWGHLGKILEHSKVNPTQASEQTNHPVCCLAFGLGDIRLFPCIRRFWAQPTVENHHSCLLFLIFSSPRIPHYFIRKERRQGFLLFITIMYMAVMPSYDTVQPILLRSNDALAWRIKSWEASTINRST